VGSIAGFEIPRPSLDPSRDPSRHSGSIAGSFAGFRVRRGILFGSPGFRAHRGSIRGIRDPSWDHWGSLTGFGIRRGRRGNRAVTFAVFRCPSREHSRDSGSVVGSLGIRDPSRNPSRDPSRDSAPSRDHSPDSGAFAGSFAGFGIHRGIIRGIPVRRIRDPLRGPLAGFGIRRSVIRRIRYSGSV
jgi:hypothetical protein